MSEDPIVPQTVSCDLPEPSAEERSTAMLPHILQVFGSFFAPLVIFLVKRDSRYVRFHSLQALIWQILATVVTTVGVLVFFGLMIFSISSIQPGPNAPPPKALFLFPLIW